MCERFLVFLALILSCATSTTANAACKQTSTLAHLAEASLGGERAFADFDDDAMRKNATKAHADLPCLGEHLTLQAAAQFHRLMALEAYTNRDNARVLREFHAARKLVPDYLLPADLAPANHPIRRFYLQAKDAKDGDSEEINAPNGGFLLVGGILGGKRFKETPVIIQAFDANKRLLETRYVQPSEATPMWGLTAKDIGVDTTPGWKKPMPWWIASGVASVVAVGFYGAAQYEKNEFNDRGTPDRELGGLQTRTNAFGYTSVSSAALAILLAGVGVGMDLAFGEKNTTRIETAPGGAATWGGGRYVE